ncbi:hypothetical protein ACWGR4_01580 [Embleya sp. NPDC055664]
MSDVVRIMPYPEVEPMTYDDESADYPDEFTVTITRDAAETIDACTVYCAHIANAYGTEDTGYRVTVASWLGNLSRVFSTPAPAPIRIIASDEFSLRVETTQGTCTLVYHPEARRCAVDGCLAVIEDDGSVWTYRADDPVCPDGDHLPTFPIDAPHPATWAIEA